MCIRDRRNASNLLDVGCIPGNGISSEVLMEAGVNAADLLIAVTSKDEINIICCLIARKLGARHTIARVRDPQYAQNLSILREDLGLSMQVNPELEADVYKRQPNTIACGYASIAWATSATESAGCCPSASHTCLLYTSRCV